MRVQSSDAATITRALDRGVSGIQVPHFNPRAEVEAAVEHAKFSRGDELVAAALAARPDVAVVDIEMPGQDGISEASELRGSLASCRTLILTMYGRPGFRAARDGGRRLPLRAEGRAGGRAR